MHITANAVRAVNTELTFVHALITREYHMIWALVTSLINLDVALLKPEPEWHVVCAHLTIGLILRPSDRRGLEAPSDLEDPSFPGPLVYHSCRLGRARQVFPSYL